ncbi:molybdenum cofactor biosynthesis protein A [Candidatus Vecturithrix granuli]|uniref:GTP 3',8-cyclase n=1 Tax=Vecturithrix granuli TaxID=1499967 RepID=A0A081C2U9_VECG1|nr:molybdenum cofactor biosynthesis protein A [Candidatus Vecturithrix granuli]
MLRDKSGRVIESLRVSVTDRCNLRCRYCMPPEGVEFIEHDEILRYEEMDRIIRVAVHLGVYKVRLTGGEPLVRKGLIDFARRLGQLEGIRKLSLTTNGILLSQYAASLKEAGVDYLNISLDTLNREKFRQITRFDRLNTVLDGIRTAKAVGFSLIKVNVVSMRGFNDKELFDFVDFADTHNIVVRFIEYMPFSGNAWQHDTFLASQELKTRLQTRYTLIPLDDDPSAPARIYKIPGKLGYIGFISSVSESFCHLCNRLRLTADGHLRPCLHGSIEIDVKHPLRRGASDAELAELFREAVDRKPAFHQDFLDNHFHSPACDREMVRIGG